MLDKLLFGKNYPIYKVEEINNKIIAINARIFFNKLGGSLSDFVCTAPVEA